MTKRNENNVDEEYWKGVHERGEEQFGSDDWLRMFTLGSLGEGCVTERQLGFYYKEEWRKKREDKKRVSRVQQ